MFHCLLSIEEGRVPDPLMPLQAEVWQPAWGDAAGSVISPQNARKRPSAPLTRLMAIIVPGTSRLRMQGVYGAIRGFVGSKGADMTPSDRVNRRRESRRPYRHVFDTQQESPRGVDTPPPYCQ